MIADAHKYVEDFQISATNKFDMIFMDINYEEDNLQLSPPRKFLDKAFLGKLLEMVTNEGFVTFNLLFYDAETQEDIYESITSVPNANKYIIEGEEDVNKVILLTRQTKKGSNATPEDLRQQQMERVIKEWGVNKGLWLTEMRIK